jgi:hypothetical protein
MNLRPLVAAASALTLAAALTACTPDAEVTPSPTAASPSVTSSPEPSPSPSSSAELRDVVEGFELASTANALRAQFPTWEPFSDGEVAVILNAGCDGIDAEGTPVGGADAIVTFGIDPADAAFGVLAAISTYCPEYGAFVSGDNS